MGYKQKLERRNRKDRAAGRASLKTVKAEEPKPVKKKRVRRTRAQIEADRKAAEEIKVQEGSNLVDH